jgi:multicomponent Na+:H+ antiporter subunit E
MSAAAQRALVFALLWLVLTEGSGRYPALAAATVAAATLASLALLPPGPARWRLAALARFVPYFLRQSLLGGLDVSRRAFHPGLPLSPAFLDWPLRLPAGPARTFFVGVLNLLPGTASTAVAGDVVRVHVLDRHASVDATLATLEERVAALYDVPLPPDPRASQPAPRPLS